MDGMNGELLVVAECPHEAAAADVLATALHDIGLGSVGHTVTIIDSQEAADDRHVVGSPTFSVDGADVFPEPDHPACVACRIYPGANGVPDLRDLRQALKKSAASSASRKSS